MLDINLNTRLEEIVNENSEMTTFFNEKRIDFCCHGYMTVSEAAEESSLEEEKLLSEIRKAFSELDKDKEDGEDIALDRFKERSTKKMIDSVIDFHHTLERKLLASIDPLLNKILLVHFENHGEELLELHRLFGNLKTELEEHFLIEEAVTFPLMLNNPKPNRAIMDRIETLEAEHEQAGELIKAMIDVTDDFNVPEDACPTFKKTYRDLDRLIKDVFLHIFKENSIIFPKCRKEV
ncbi:MAG: DUF542 domain-containing protein [Peptoniphilus sp.]|nr:DUF542 domain-containing protein [Peptoniphilus sp.]MDD7362849.1 DUF542 domain-containing protein [Bacillota bacterium]MDY6043959.1 DUF542 domain-containing protein [Peptoniphilus sp.]